MINFIFNTDKYDKIGIKYRYQDFNSFLKDYKIEYSISNACQKHCFNIVDLFYLYENHRFKLDNSCYIFCGSSKKIFETIPRHVKCDIISDYRHYLSHNLYYAQCFNGVFLPMYLHYNDIIHINKSKSYKYGIFASDYDVSYLIFNEVFNKLDIDYNDILFMDNSNCVSRELQITNDKNVFYSSIDTFLDFANDYTNRHVMSRTYLELIANNIPIQIVSFNNSKPISFRGFSHIEYETVAEYHLFDLLNVKYEPKYFRTDTYSDYIKYALNNLNKPIKLATVEEYSN